MIQKSLENSRVWSVAWLIDWFHSPHNPEANGKQQSVVVLVFFSPEFVIRSFFLFNTRDSEDLREKMMETRKLLRTNLICSSRSESRRSEKDRVMSSSRSVSNPTTSLVTPFTDNKSSSVRGIVLDISLIAGRPINAAALGKPFSLAKFVTIFTMADSQSSSSCSNGVMLTVPNDGFWTENTLLLLDDWADPGDWTEGGVSWGRAVVWLVEAASKSATKPAKNASSSTFTTGSSSNFLSASEI